MAGGGVIFQGGMEGALWECAVLAAVDCTSPCPIERQLGGNNKQYLKRLHKFTTSKPNAPLATLEADRETELLANLAAFEFWQKKCRDSQRGGTGLTDTQGTQHQQHLARSLFLVRGRGFCICNASCLNRSELPPLVCPSRGTHTSGSGRPREPHVLLHEFFDPLVCGTWMWFA